MGNSKFGGESPDAGRQQLRALVLTALTELRESLRGLSTFKLAVRTVAFRPGPLACPEAAVKQVLKALACRWLDLGREIAEFEGSLSKVVSAAASALVAYTGSVPKWQPPSLVAAGDSRERLKSESSFAALCGVCALPGSSRNTQRHRLNRGRNQQATLSMPEIICCLKRYVARELYPAVVSTLALDGP